MHPSPPETRASLILRLQDAADVAAWDEFVGVYAPVVYRVAVGRGFQAADAQDLVQEVMLSVARSVEQWLGRTDRGSFRAWLLRIARNEAFDQINARATRKLGTDGSEAENMLANLPAKTDLSSELDLQYERTVFRWAAEQVRDSVAEHTWMAFWLTRVEGISVEQAADQLGIRPGNIYFARSRVMARIQDSEATQASASNDGTPHIFDGEWKLKSYINEGEPLTELDGVPATGWVKEREVSIFNDIIPYTIVESDGNTAKLRLADSEEIWIATRANGILRIVGEEREVELEFWRVDPKRAGLMRDLRVLQAEAMKLKVAGDTGKLLSVNQQIESTTRELKKIDFAIEVMALNEKSLTAREAGDHALADRLDQEAATLAEGLFDKPVSFLSESTSLADYFNSATNIEYHYNSDLTTATQTAEQESLDAASRYHELAADPTIEDERLAIAEAKLRLTVQKAFEARWRLQEVRLQKMKSDIAQLESTHQRRKQLADKVIERRLKELKNRDELSWTQAAAGMRRQMKNGAATSSAVQINPQLEGDWKRVQPLPTFSTPEELLAYFDKASQGDTPDVEAYVGLLTDEEATRFAGVMIASAGVMNRMMPLLMMASQMEGNENPGLSSAISTYSMISSLLQDAVSPTAAPQCVKAFEDFTKPDTSIFTGQYVAPIVDMQVFSEKLKLAGGAVGDPRSFSIQLMQLLASIGNNSGDSNANPDKPKPVWVVSRDGDRAIAVNQASASKENDMTSGTLELVRVADTWKIEKIIDDSSLAKLAKSTTGGLVGADQDGNEVQLSGMFQPDSSATTTHSPALPLTLESALQQQRFTNPIVTGPSTLSFSHKGEGNFPEFLPEYLNAAYEQLKPLESDDRVKLEWGPKQLELLRSIDPAMQLAKIGNPWNLKRFGRLAERFVVENTSAETNTWPTQDSPWSADMLTRIAKTTGRLPDAVFATKHGDLDVRQRLQLLETMVFNGATSNWIAQEEIRLANLLHEAPVETLRLLVEYPAAEDAYEYKRWLYVVCGEEFSDHLKTTNNISCGQPVDSVLLTLILANFAGQSEVIDDRIGMILDPDPLPGDVQGAYRSSTRDSSYITRQLHDLLSNDYAYREIVIDALVRIYGKSKSEKLKQNIAEFAPSIPVLATN